MSTTEQVNYISTGETTGIWVTIDGKQVLFVKEDYLREKISQDILAIAYWGYEEVLPGGYVVKYISKEDAASIARGV